MLTAAARELPERAATRRRSSPSTSGATSGRPAGPPTWRSSSCCTGTAWPARPSCSASTAPCTGRASARASSAATRDVPLMIVAVGDGARVAAPLPELEALLRGRCSRSSASRLQARRREARRAARRPRTDPSGSASGRSSWSTRASSRATRAPALGPARAGPARAGAAGATSLRGIWGYHGDHAPHGDTFWQLRRRVPVVTVVVDTPDRIRGWFAVVDALTDETGLVTSELVPAFRATGQELDRGGLRLARP